LGVKIIKVNGMEPNKEEGPKYPIKERNPVTNEFLRTPLKGGQRNVKKAIAF